MNTAIASEPIIKPIINLTGVTKSFGSTQVLKQINLDVRQGEVLVLIGASGSGKSTVLRIMSGLETADAGEVWVNEVPLHDARRAREIRGHVGMVFQQFNLFPHKNALGNVSLALIKARKMNPADAASARWRHWTAWVSPTERITIEPIVRRPAATGSNCTCTGRGAGHHVLR